MSYQTTLVVTTRLYRIVTLATHKLWMAIMVEVESIIELIRDEALPDLRVRYCDTTWFCVGLELRRGPSAGDDNALIVSEVQVRQFPNRNPGLLLELANALEDRSRELGIPLIAITAKPKFARMLLRRGYIQLDPNVPVDAQQTWKRLPNA